MRTRKWRERAAACGVVVAWHVAGWWLLHATRMATGSGADAALQVVYVDLPPPRGEAPHARTAGSARRRRPHAGHAAAARKTTAALQAPPATPSAAPSLPPQDALVREAARRALAGDPPPPRDPFADRPSRLPGHDVSGRFRMAEPVTPARVVAAIGALLFYPPGYDPDPCPRNAANIGNLLAAGDSPELQLELDFERRHCRP
jgi:hypothetical protein